MASTAAPVGPALGLLPPELKSLIVEFVALVDEEGDFEDEDEDAEDGDEEHDCSKHAPGEHNHTGGGHKHSHGEGKGEDHEHTGDCCKGPLPAMVALSLVNREFAELAYPYIYKIIELDSCSNIDLTVFIIDILPRHGKHVEMISCNLDEFVDYTQGEEDEQVIEELEKVIESVVETAKNPSDFGLEFSTRQRHNLMAHIIKNVPNLNTVGFTIEPIPASGSGEGALIALQSVGEKIIDITLDGSGGSFDSLYLSNFLKSFPNLLRLDLDFSSLDRHGETELINTIASFPKLTNLYISSAEFVNEEFANADWKAPLEILALSDVDDFKFPDFVNLISHFSSTLKTLDIDDCPDYSHEEDNKKFLGKPFDLPHLETLVLATQHAGSFLNSFSNCPINELTICHCPSITVANWEGFVSSHQATLKTVNLENDNVFSESQIEGFELWLMAKDIECNVEPEDSDDEDDDEDEEEYEDDYDGVGTDDQFEEEDSEGDGFSDEEEM